MAEQDGGRRLGLELLTGPAGMTFVFALVHGIWGLLVASDQTQDVDNMYRFWIDQWRDGAPLVGVGTNWVYPIGALLPMIAASAGGDDGYALVWQAIVAALDAGALILLAHRSRLAAWWWLAFTAALGEIALGRIDAVALPFAVVGVLLLSRRPAIAGALLAGGAWIKVWPATLVLAAVVAGRRRLPVLAGAAAVTAVVVAVAAALGALPHLFSFLGAQTGRGLQIEAPVTVPWLWIAASGGPVVVYYDLGILTFQVQGPGAATAAVVMTPVLAAGVLALCALALRARLRGADAMRTTATLGLGLVTAVIALNKVGSPQYFTWFVAPVVLGLLVDARRFRVPAVLGLVMAVLTDVIYPWFYNSILLLQPVMLAVLSVRDLLELVLLAWSLAELISLVPRRAPGLVVPR